MPVRSPRPSRIAVGTASRDGSTHPSLGLKHALRRFRAVGGSKVLDLGPAVGRNVQFLSPFISKLYIADLHTTIRKRSGRGAFESDRLRRILKRDLPHASEGPIDLVLAWDLPNYLDRQQLELLGARLAELCRPDTLILTLISTLKRIPELPTRYLILDAETLRYENESRRDRPSPGYREPDLGRLLPAFEVETSFLLRHGVQEYVLTRRSSASPVLRGDD